MTLKSENITNIDTLASFSILSTDIWNLGLKVRTFLSKGVKPSWWLPWIEEVFAPFQLGASVGFPRSVASLLCWERVRWRSFRICWICGWFALSWCKKLLSSPVATRDRKILSFCEEKTFFSFICLALCCWRSMRIWQTMMKNEENMQKRSQMSTSLK